VADRPDVGAFLQGSFLNHPPFSARMPSPGFCHCLMEGEDGMRLPDTSRRRTPFRFNITPMIDVVFLLIIFFLVASYFVRSEQSREVTLPDADKGQLEEQSRQNRLTITIEKNGSLSIGGQLLSKASVIERIQELRRDDGPPPELRIRADRDARFIEVRQLIEHCAANGIHNIQFAVASPRE
jgi:biopolymer transport protein ExbD